MSPSRVSLAWIEPKRRLVGFLAASAAARSASATNPALSAARFALEVGREEATIIAEATHQASRLERGFDFDLQGNPSQVGLVHQHQAVVGQGDGIDELCFRLEGRPQGCPQLSLFSNDLEHQLHRRVLE